MAGLFIFSSAKTLSRDVAASVIATWMVMVTPNVWLLSTQAEVYTLNLMWVSAVLWAALNWYGTSQQKYLVALFFFYALSFGNHLTMITLLPGLAFLILAKDPKVVLRWQNWVWSTLAILTGLLQYGLLLWRSYHPHPALLSRFPRQANLDELLEYVSGSRFVDRHFLKTGFEGWLPRLWDGISYSVEQLTLPFALLCGLGLFLGFREQRRPTIFLALTAATVMAFAAAYGIKDSLFYTIPAWVCAALLGAAGLSRISSWSRGWRRQIVAILALLVVSLTVWRGSRLTVVDNPTDLESVITAATPGSGILAAIKQRRARLLRLYYRYGQVTEKAHQVDFHSVDEILASGLENVRDQPLFFRDPETARRLDRAVIDYRLLQTLPNDQNLYLTEPEEPLEALALRPLWDGSLAITLRQRSLDLLGAQTLHLFLVSSRYGRSKGYVAIDIESPADWRPLLESALTVAASGDRFLLVAPRLAERPRRDLARILESQRIDLLSLPIPQHHTVAWWTAGGSANEVTLISDLAEALILEIDSPVDDSEDSTAAN